jgi:ketosteroid isomerase-like protein
MANILAGSFQSVVCSDPADIHRHFIIALLKQDIDAALSLYHPRASFVPGADREPVSGNAAIRTQLEAFAEIASSMELVERSMTIADGHAQVKMRWRLSTTDEVFTALDVLQKQADGRWLFLIDNPYGV